MSDPILSFRVSGWSGFVSILTDRVLSLWEFLHVGTPPVRYFLQTSCSEVSNRLSELVAQTEKDRLSHCWLVLEERLCMRSVFPSVDKLLPRTYGRSAEDDTKSYLR